MNTPCPHCKSQIEIDPETLAALQGHTNFPCPSCSGLVPVPAVLRSPVKVAAAAIRSVPSKAPASTLASVFLSLNRNMLILGAAALLVLGGLGFFIASKKSGDTNYTVSNISYQEIQNNYFSQIIVNGTTTKEELAKIQDIKPYGTLFIGMSKEALSLTDALDLAKRTGSTILDYTTDQPNKPAPLNLWITNAFSLEKKAWVSLHSQHQVIDGKAQLSSATAEAQHHVLLAWQGPRELMMNAPIQQLEEKSESKEPSADIVSHPLNGIFSSPNGNGSGRYALNAHPEGRVSGLYFDGNPVSNASVTGHIKQDKISISHVSNYDLDKGVCYLELQLETDGNYSVTQYGKINGERAGDFRYIITRQGLGGVQESIRAAEHGPIEKESRLVLDRCLEIALNEPKSNSEITAEIDPKRKYFQLDSLPHIYLENYEPGKWRETDNGKPVYNYTEKSRDNQVIEIHDGSRDYSMRLYSKSIELRTPFNNVFESWNEGKWVESLGNSDVIERGIPSDALEFDGHYYKFYPSKKNWEEAQKECESRGGHLATALTLPENHQISLLGKNEHVWVGANNIVDGTRWMWLDGNEIDRELWSWQCPRDSENSKYVILFRGFLQHSNLTNSYVTGYVCEWDEDTAKNLERSQTPTEESPALEQKIPVDAREYRGNRYLIYNSHENWYAAEEHCKSLCGSLASVGSQVELNFIMKYIEEKGFMNTDIWLGACNLYPNDQWRWNDGSLNTLTNVIESDVSNSYLVALNGNLIAKKNGSHYGKIFICEWEGDEEIPDAEVPQEAPMAKQTLTNKAGVSIEVEILSATDTHVKVRLLKNNQEYDLKLETLNQEAQDLIEAWKITNPNF